MIRLTAGLPAAIGLLLPFMTLGTSSHATEEFHSFITPETTYAELHDFVDVHLDVDSTARRFNGFEVTIRYDPSVVSLDSVMPGDLMTDACPELFSRLETTDSTLTYVLITLCDLVTVYGPGRLCSIRFNADRHGFSPVAIVSDPDRTFLDAGLYVYPGHPTYPRQVIMRDGVILVFDPNAGCEEHPREEGVTFSSILPNPASELTHIQFELPKPAVVRVVVHDAMGREVRTLINDYRGAGNHSVTWDSSDNDGRRVSSGIYLCRIAARDFQSRSRIVLMR